MIYNSDLRPVVDEVLGPSFGTDPMSAPDRARLWSVAVELEWPMVGIPESGGGAGGELVDVAELAAGLGRHAVPLPLVETGAAAWVLSQVGLPVDLATGGATVAVAQPGQVKIRTEGDRWQLDGVIPAIRWLGDVPTVVLVAEYLERCAVLILERAAARVEVADDLSGEPVGELHLDGVLISGDLVSMGAPDLATATLERTALLRAAAIGGALERACALTAEHVRTRRQFGRPLVALQAVAHSLADMAVERDLVGAAVAAALDSHGLGGTAAARATAARSAGVVAERAHQLHGAMGITREHPLHLVTRRLWAWRDEGGSQRQWELLVGDGVLAGQDDDALWSLVTGGVA